MAKIFKFTGYFVDPAGECNKRDVKTALEEVTTNAGRLHMALQRNVEAYRR